MIPILTLNRVDKSSSVQEQINQMQSQIYQLKEQLEMILSAMDIETKKEVEVAKSDISDMVQSSTVEYDSFKSKITQTANKISAQVEDNTGNIATLTETSTAIETRVSNAEGNISTLTQTASGLETRVTSAEGDASEAVQTANEVHSAVFTDTGESRISQNATAIDLKVDVGGCISDINLTEGTATINADKIKFEGYTLINNNFQVDKDGNLQISADTCDLFFGDRTDTSSEGMQIKSKTSDGSSLYINSSGITYYDPTYSGSRKSIFIFNAYCDQETGKRINFGNMSKDTDIYIYGKQDRPKYNLKELALLEDITGGGSSYDYGFDGYTDASSWSLIQPYTTSSTPYYFNTDAGTGDSTTVPTIALVKAMINYALGTKKFT